MSSLYPYIPRSTAKVAAGDFWAVPLGAGGFACGRVIQTEGDELVNPRRMFFGGLLDWHSSSPPDGEAIAGCALLECGEMHVKAIQLSGGEILGNRPLQLDAIEPPLLLSAAQGPATLLRGVQSIRAARKDEWGTLPALQTWGLNVITLLAEHYFAGGSDVRPT